LEARAKWHAVLICFLEQGKIEADIKTVEQDILKLLREVAG
jgi:hypothetical protein